MSRAATGSSVIGRTGLRFPELAGKGNPQSPAPVEARCGAGPRPGSRQPPRDLLVYGGSIEQVPVVHAIANPLPGFPKGQRSAKLTMTAQSAVHRHEPVAWKNVTLPWKPVTLPGNPITGAGDLACRGSGNCVTLHTSGQWHRAPLVPRTLKAVAAFPVFIQQVAVTQVGDAGTANPAETEQRGSVWA